MGLLSPQQITDRIDKWEITADDTLIVEWNSGHKSTFNSSWLRDRNFLQNEKNKRKVHTALPKVSSM